MPFSCVRFMGDLSRTKFVESPNQIDYRLIQAAGAFGSATGEAGDCTYAVRSAISLLTASVAACFSPPSAC